MLLCNVNYIRIWFLQPANQNENSKGSLLIIGTNAKRSHYWPDYSSILIAARSVLPFFCSSFFWNCWLFAVAFDLRVHTWGVPALPAPDMLDYQLFDKCGNSCGNWASTWKPWKALDRAPQLNFGAHVKLNIRIVIKVWSKKVCIVDSVLCWAVSRKTEYKKFMAKCHRVELQSVIIFEVVITAIITVTAIILQPVCCNHTPIIT